MHTAVLILNYNGVGWLPAIYDALAQQDAENVRVYLVDNASTDESITFTINHYPAVKIIQMAQNVGFSMAYNVATPIAFDDGCDTVVWANNDIRLATDCLRIMEETLARDERIGIVGPAFLEWTSDEPNRYMREVNPYALDAMSARRVDPVPVAWVEGSILMIRKRCFESVGPLDPGYFFYWEEADYCRRARHHGWRVVIAPSAIARHYGGGSVGSPTHRDRFIRLKTRNEYIYRGTDPTRSWPENLSSIAHLAAVKLKAGLLDRSTTLPFEMAALFDASGKIATMRRKWQRDRSRQLPPPSTGAEAVKWTILSEGGFAE